MSRVITLRVEDQGSEGEGPVIGTWLVVVTAKATPGSSQVSCAVQVSKAMVLSTHRPRATGEAE